MSRIWPSDVPYEQNADGATLPQSYNPPSSYEVEGGPAIMRRRPGPRATMIPWTSIPLTEAQWERLDLFFRETLLEGTLTFTMQIYRPNQGYVSRICQIEKGTFDTDQSQYPIYFVSFNLVIFNF